jgi:hypothetical protein
MRLFPVEMMRRINLDFMLIAAVNPAVAADGEMFQTAF